MKRVLIALGFALAIGSSASAADPTPFLSTSGTCREDAFLRLPPSGAAHSGVIVRLVTSGSGAFFVHAGNRNGNRVMGPDTIWEPFRPMGAGDAAELHLQCQGAYAIELFDVPETPTSFTGATSYLSQGTSGGDPGTGSLLAFRVPGEAQYVADVSLSQGAVRVALCCDAATREVIASSGTFALGKLDAGEHGLDVRPVDGPQARWTIKIRALPVVLSDVRFDQGAARPGTTVRASYSVTGDASLTARIISATGDVTRTLGESFGVGPGERSLHWDGLDSAGRPVRDGPYRLRLELVDRAGHQASATAELVIDGSGPKILLKVPRVLPASRGLVVRTTDALAGMRSVTLSVNKRVVARASGKQITTYRPSRGWLRGRYTLEVVATDALGNTTRVRRIFVVPASAVSDQSAMPVPSFGSAALRSYPYSRSIPAFPTNVEGYVLRRKYGATLRVFQGKAWEPVPRFSGPSLRCGSSRWFLRWRSANADVTLRAAAIIAPDLVVKTTTEGGAGYIASDSCYAPVFKFGSALRGNQSNLADVYLEWQLWTAKRRI